MGGAGPGVVGPALEVGRPLDARRALVGGGQAWRGRAQGKADAGGRSRPWGRGGHRVRGGSRGVGRALEVGRPMNARRAPVRGGAGREGAGPGDGGSCRRGGPWSERGNRPGGGGPRWPRTGRAGQAQSTVKALGAGRTRVGRAGPGGGGLRRLLGRTCRGPAAGPAHHHGEAGPAATGTAAAAETAEEERRLKTGPPGSGPVNPRRL